MTVPEGFHLNALRGLYPTKAHLFQPVLDAPQDAVDGALGAADLLADLGQ